MATDIRWLGHSAFHLSGGGADVLEVSIAKRTAGLLMGHAGFSEVLVLDPGDTHTLR